jgi:hypothetical protein
MTTLVPLYPPSDFVPGGGTIETVDIETGFDDDDFISVALPAFPEADIDIEASYIEFTSNVDGNFGAGPSAQVTFDQSTETLVAGDSELRFALGLINTIDLSAVTGVRFSITATDTCDFRVLAIRALHKDWTYAPLDMNTRYNRGVRPVSPDGDPTPTLAFPSNTLPFPILWRSADPSGNGDPTPVDAHMSVAFNTGTAAQENTFSIYFRERSQDLITMLELDGTPLDELDGLPQPDFGEAGYAPRTQLDLDGIADSVSGPGVDSGADIDDGLTQADLNGVHQFDLERKADTLTAAWIEVRVSWSSTEAWVEIYDAENPAPYYTFEISLSADSSYFLFVELEERSLQARIFEAEGNQLGDKVFDSTKIVDPSVFKRRKGRLGWSASLLDGDAYIGHIRPRYLNFAEYRSHPFESITPVAGTQLQAGASQDSDLFQGIYPGPWGGQFTDYPERGPEAFKIRNTAVEPLQGVQSQPIYFDDFPDTEIEADILLTQEALDAGSLLIFLWDGYHAIDLPVGALEGDVWNHVSIDLSTFAQNLVPGYYSIVMVQSVIGLPNDWIIDKVSVNRRNIGWAGRAYVPDAWGLHEDDWIPFKNALNDPYDGIVFRERTNALQVRARALRQDVFIGQLRVTPKYAELGRVVWAEEGHVPSAGSGPTASFTPSISALTVSFVSTATDTNGYIANNSWTFGDGAADTGTIVSHTYEAAGTYPVTLTVTDDNGERDSVTTDVTVS